MDQLGILAILLLIAGYLFEKFAKHRVPTWLLYLCYVLATVLMGILVILRVSGSGGG